MNLGRTLAVIVLLLAVAPGPNTGRSIGLRLLPAPAMAQDFDGGDGPDGDGPDRDGPDRDGPDKVDPDKAEPDKAEPAATPTPNEKSSVLDLLDSADNGNGRDPTNPAPACRTIVIVAGAVTGAVVGDLIAGGLLISTLVGYLAPSAGVVAPSAGAVAAGAPAYAWSVLSALIGAGIGAGTGCALIPGNEPGSLGGQEGSAKP